jgi:dienelactone hydrolase
LVDVTRSGDGALDAACYPMMLVRTATSVRALSSVALMGLLSLVGCSGDDPAADPPAEAPPGAGDPGSSSGAPGSSGGASSGGTASSSSGAPGTDAGASSSGGPGDPGPAPTKNCNIATNRFVARNSGGAKYVVFVPKGYTGQPTRLLVGLHGCGDSAMNYADWGVAPFEKRATQTHIGISVDGASGNSGCWNVANDAAKVQAAIDDISQCLYVHQKQIVISGYSSGGILAYTLGLQNADKYAGILILNSGLYSTGKADALLAGAARKIPIAHRAHQNDTTFPQSKVVPDWNKIEAAGFPLDKATTPGDHNGTSGDWADGLHPKMAAWEAP